MATYQQGDGSGRPPWEASVKSVLVDAVKDAMLSGTADPLESIGQFVLRQAAAMRGKPNLEIRYHFRGVW